MEEGEKQMEEGKHREVGKKIKWIIVILIVVFGVYFFTRTGDVGEDVIAIGFVGPLTGDAVSYGEPMSNAVRMAVADINQAGGVNGSLLRVIYEDGRCTNKDALNAAQKLVNVDGVKMIVGGICSGESLAMLPATEPASVIVFSPSSTAPALTGSGRFFIRNVPSDLESGRALAEVVLQGGFTKVAVITEETDYAQGFAQVFQQYMALGGGEVLADERFAPKTTDFRSILTKIKALEPEAIFVNPQTEIAGGAIVKQIRELGITVPIYGSSITGAKKSIEIAGEHINDMVFIDAPGLRLDNPIAADFLNRYRAQYGESGIDFYTGAAYDAVHIFASAIAAVGSAEDTEALRQHIGTMGDFSGVIGTYRFRPDGDPEGIGFAVRKVVDGSVEVFEIVEGGGEMTGGDETTEEKEEVGEGA